MHIAVDVLGGDGLPTPILAGAVAALRDDPRLTISLVGPAPLCQQGLTDAGDIAARVTVVPATQVVEMQERPVDAVRNKNEATVCVAADLVAAGAVDAMVSIGSTGAVMAACIFGLGLLPGLSRPALAVTLPAADREVVLLDVGANMVPAATILTQHALLGAAYAQDRLGVSAPRVGLLTIGSEAGKGDATRRASFDMLSQLPIQFIGNVEGDEVLGGGVADVVVTDGFTGNVLLKGMEGTYALLAGLVAQRLENSSGELRELFGRATAHLHPDRAAGALLLGLNGLVVVGHGRSSSGAVATCIAQAVDAVRQDALAQLQAKLAHLVLIRSTSLAGAAP